MCFALNRVDDSAERILRYSARAGDLASEHTGHDVPMLLSHVQLVYTRRNGSPWVLDRVDVTGYRSRTDASTGPVSRATQRFHVSLDPFTVTTEFGVHAPPWLRGFTWNHRDPDAVDQPDGARTA
ncbi:hypothetical protein [Streptomyces yaizuensis]|uniref:Uncharacterized protein n=1 Tax=Streptomyces yaizuensis TaxID=2989713 RepID=A0ABQ5P6Q1_9ACTN|nr:hypothetical protein [Streptomyces sp. YSPA8]GLF98267.1 hypothetical protein SYYSPA8_28240 [Streptomyces sp. YSPA8]